MVSPRVISKEDVRNEVSPISSNAQREILETSKDSFQEEPNQPNLNLNSNDPISSLKPTIIPIQSNVELVLERKKKQKPDQLIFVKTLLTINFFGFVIIVLNAIFFYIRLFWVKKNLEKSNEFENSLHQWVLIVIIGLLADVLYAISWLLYFVSGLKRMLKCLILSVFLVFFSTIFKITSFLIFLAVFGEENGNNGFIIATTIYIVFQIFSIWNYAYVQKKMKGMPEKNWKKAFRRPKGKYMYPQD